jgi:hypothetical protein
MSDCERCQERDEQEAIMKSFDAQKKNEESSCSCAVKPAEKVDLTEDPQFRVYYNFVASFSKQLKDCLLSGVSFQERMLKLYDELKCCDMVRDHGKIVRIIREILDIARMQETNASVTKKTAEMLEERMSGTH